MKVELIKHFEIEPYVMINAFPQILFTVGWYVTFDPNGIITLIIARYNMFRIIVILDSGNKAGEAGLFL